MGQVGSHGESPRGPLSRPVTAAAASVSLCRCHCSSPALPALPSGYTACDPRPLFCSSGVGCVEAAARGNPLKSWVLGPAWPHLRATMWLTSCSDGFNSNSLNEPWLSEEKRPETGAPSADNVCNFTCVSSHVFKK